MTIAARIIRGCQHSWVVVWYIAMVVVLVFTNLQFLTSVVAPQPPIELPVQQQPKQPRKYPQKKNQNKRKGSHPPEPMELFATKDPAILMRHHCIDAIRNRHFEFYQSVFPPKAMKDVGRVLLVEPAYHANVGDHMLTLGEYKFMKQMGLSEPLECYFVRSNRGFPSCFDMLKSKLPNDTKVAMWHAGGNWGDIWRKAQSRRIRSFQILLENNLTVISMPQSLHYNSNYTEAKEAESIRNGILGRHHIKSQNASEIIKRSRVTLAWREQESYERAKQLYPFVDNVVVPDIAFQLGPYPPIPLPNGTKKVDLLIFLRGDIESNILEETFQNDTRKQGNKREITADVVARYSNQTGMNLTYQIVDWSDRRIIFQDTNWLFTDTAIQLLSLGRVVICDRLHAAILAYLAGLPFVFIDQKTKKITKTLGVAFESAKLCQDGETARWGKGINLEQAVKKAVEFLDRYKLKNDKN